MADSKIEPSRITKPIQLLAAWLAGLILTNGSFLATAAAISTPSWAPGALVVASIANVPVFLVCLFLLQTKFRPEMQEDEFYTRYLDRRYSPVIDKMELVETRARVGSLTEAKQIMANSLRETSVEPAPALVDEVTKVLINDLIPKYETLLSELLKTGIHVHDTFGSTSDEPRMPRPFIVSFGNSVPMATVKSILRVAMKFGLEGVALTSGDYQNLTTVYIGPYGYEKGDERYLKLDAEILGTLLGGELDDSQAMSMIRLASASAKLRQKPVD